MLYFFTFYIFFFLSPLKLADMLSQLLSTRLKNSSSEKMRDSHCTFNKTLDVWDSRAGGSQKTVLLSWSIWYTCLLYFTQQRFIRLMLVYFDAQRPLRNAGEYCHFTAFWGGFCLDRVECSSSGLCPWMRYWLLFFGIQRRKKCSNRIKLLNVR